MKMPGFSAEASLYSSSETYWLAGTKMSLDEGQVVPAEGFGYAYKPEDLASFLGGSLWDLNKYPFIGPFKECVNFPKICIDKYGRRYKCGSFWHCPK